MKLHIRPSTFRNLPFCVLSAAIVQVIFFGKPNFVDSIFLITAFGILSVNRVSRSIALFICCSLALLLPGALVMRGGIFTPVVLDVVASSNTGEAWDFIATLPQRFILIGIGVFLLEVLFFWLCRSTKNSHLNFKIASVVVCFSAFVVHHLNAFALVKEEMLKLSIDSLPPTSWQVRNQANHFDTYVLVLGESMRADFMSLYGYNHKTTPFLDSLNKTYLEKYVATGVNTVIALPRALALTNQEGNLIEQDNIITLAKQAGLKTYWLSGQGYAGNGVISRISNFADYQFFTKKDDLDLFPVIEKVLNNPERKLVIIHLFGSHEHACNRVKNYGIHFDTGAGKLVDCYASSIKKTDYVLKTIHSHLTANHKSWSMIYFSDHGMNFVPSGDDYKVFRDELVQTSYDVPFIESNSQMKGTTKLEGLFSAKDFVNYVPTWIGVQTNLTPHGFDLTNLRNSNPKVRGYEKSFQFNELDTGRTASEHRLD